MVAEASSGGQARGLSEELARKGGARAERFEEALGDVHRSPGSGPRRVRSALPSMEGWQTGLAGVG